jgi:hypothetical protein
MPQFYATDDLQSWIHCCIEERYDDSDSEYLQLVTEDIKSLKDACRDMLEMAGIELGTLMDALMNTIDFENLLENLKNQYEDDLAKLNAPEVVYDKDAGIDHTDKSFSTAVSACVAFGCTETGNEMVWVATHGWMCKKHRD